MAHRRDLFKGRLDLAITRRQLLQSSAFAALTPALGAMANLSVARSAQAQAAGEPTWHHALSLFGDIKYPADFKRFDYVNPDAPKGGTVRQLEIGTFDNFNLVVSGLKGSLAGGVERIYEALTNQSMDEVETSYGQLAESASYPD